MSKREEYEKRTEQLVEPILAERGFELVDVEYVKEGGNRELQVYIDKEGGITINECAEVNRTLSDLLDEDDFIDDASYILVVSSPGLGRQLKKEKDFLRNIGKDIDIKLYKDVELVENKKVIKAKEFAGRLDGYENDGILVFLGEETRKFLFKEIASVRLSIDF